MEIKKSQKADLEGKKSTSMLIGYVLVLAAIFVAFEWTQREKKVVELEPVFSCTENCRSAEYRGQRNGTG